MARAPKNATPVTEETETEDQITQTTAIINWDEELANMAKIAAGMEANTGGGQYFSLRGGILAFNDQAMPNNEMAVIVLDSILENVFYEGAYDPDNVSPPTCFAFGRDDETIKPHSTVFAAEQAQHEQCGGCPMNAFGTAEKGRGKACRNTRRLAMIPAGTFNKAGDFEAFDEPDQFLKAPIAMMKLPVTSVRAYATFVKQVAGTLNRPLLGIFTKIKVVSDVKTQFRVIFEPLEPLVPNQLIPILIKRNKEAALSIDTPYSLTRDEPAAATAPARGKPAPKNVRPEVKKPTKKY